MLRWVQCVVLAAGPIIAQPFAYVANHDDGDVSVIDTANNTIVATVPVGLLPQTLGQFILPGPPPAVPTLSRLGAALLLLAGLTVGYLRR